MIPLRCAGTDSVWKELCLKKLTRVHTRFDWTGWNWLNRGAVHTEIGCNKSLSAKQVSRTFRTKIVGSSRLSPAALGYRIWHNRILQVFAVLLSCCHFQFQMDHQRRRRPWILSSQFPINCALHSSHYAPISWSCAPFLSVFPSI